MTAVLWEQGDEEVGWREKEMRDDPSVTTDRVDVSRLKDSARLSDKGKKKKTPISEQEHSIQFKLSGFEKALTVGMGIILADTIFRTLEHELKDFHIAEVQIVSL